MISKALYYFFLLLPPRVAQTMQIPTVFNHCVFISVDLYYPVIVLKLFVKS